MDEECDDSSSLEDDQGAPETPRTIVYQGSIQGERLWRASSLPRESFLLSFWKPCKKMSILFGGGNLDDPFHPWKYCQELFTSLIIPMRPMETGKWGYCAFILNLCISDCLCKIGRSCSGSWQVRPYIYDHLTARPSKLWRPDWPSFILPTPPALHTTNHPIYHPWSLLCGQYFMFSFPT